MTPSQYAVIEITTPTIDFRRPAVMVWRTESWFAWLEPSYANYQGGPPAFHVVAVTDEYIPSAEGGFYCRTEDAEYMVRDWLSIEDDDPARSLEEDFDAYDAWLRERRSTYAQEKQLMADRLLPPEL